MKGPQAEYIGNERPGRAKERAQTAAASGKPPRASQTQTQEKLAGLVKDSAPGEKATDPHQIFMEAESLKVQLKK